MDSSVLRWFQCRSSKCGLFTAAGIGVNRNRAHRWAVSTVNVSVFVVVVNVVIYTQITCHDHLYMEYPVFSLDLRGKFVGENLHVRKSHYAKIFMCGSHIVYIMDMSHTRDHRGHYQ